MTAGRPAVARTLLVSLEWQQAEGALEGTLKGTLKEVTSDWPVQPVQPVQQPDTSSGNHQACHPLPTWPDLDRSAADELDQLARRLADALPELIHHEFAAARTSHDRSEGRLRIYFELRSPGLDPVPWELLRLARNQLFTHPDYATARWVSGGSTPQPAGAPLRVLVVVGSGKESLQAAEEQRALWTAAGLAEPQWIVEILDRPSRDELATTIVWLQPDILHFVGHPSPAAGRTGRPGLEIGDPDAGGCWALTADVIADIAGCAPPLAVLNACEAENREPAGHAAGVVATLAKQLLRRGSGAVLCTQGSWDSSDAVRMCARLYSRLAENTPIDEALQDARSELATTGGRAWGRPVLYLAADPDRLLEQRGELHGHARRRFDSTYPSTPARQPHARSRAAIVGRNAIVVKLLSRLGKSTTPVVVTGSASAGKSTVVRMAAALAQRHGTAVLYVDLGQYVRRLDPADVLARICDTIGSWYADELGDEFAAQLAETNEAIAAVRDAPRRRLLPAPRGDRSATSDPEIGPNIGKAAFTAVINLLHTVAGPAGTAPLVLVIDQLASVDPRAMEEELSSDFLDQIRWSPSERIQLVLVDDVAERISTARGATPLVVPRFAVADAENLIEEFVARRGFTWEPRMSSFKSLVSGRDDWSPGLLYQLAAHGLLGE